MVMAATHIPLLAYLINIVGAVLGLIVGGCIILIPQKANEYFGRSNIRLESTPEDNWWRRYFVPFRIIGVILTIASVAAMVSTVRSLLH
jgi:NADH:ubiquinone oxidoreductase subunit 6 (subunit J)